VKSIVNTRLCKNACDVTLMFSDYYNTLILIRSREYRAKSGLKCSISAFWSDPCSVEMVHSSIFCPYGHATQRTTFAVCKLVFLLCMPPKYPIAIIVKLMLKE